ncbi:DNA polymerase III subunit epsilon [Hyphobacterium sp. SN044]|uniref:DNA polymerase III subunit epsilon n=1 Tax=Hyphobacterium sp. SN044 TaxID=2912575 RepID=UPI001F020AD3|nr:DNA polymerase III subunit epsilon [Hyphobacterium sp. SN044]MCF8880456.1 DNA polymerase III subunit epsilon [Hyphobacterium sp. SN044]
MREIILDTETTGLDCNLGDRITEIGCVEVVDCIPTGRTFHTYVNPQRDVPEIVTKITGLTAEFLADKPLFEDVAEKFCAFVGDAVIVAHNAPFDAGFVNMELGRLGRDIYPSQRFKDTVRIAREKFPGAHASLDALCKRFNISLETRDKHGALVDALLLAEVYLELNGGRTRALDLAGDGGNAGAKVAFPARPQRPVPLASRIRDEERAAHDAFLETLGGALIWKKFGSA